MASCLPRWRDSSFFKVQPLSIAPTAAICLAIKGCISAWLYTSPLPVVPIELIFGGIPSSMEWVHISQMYHSPSRNWKRSCCVVYAKGLWSRPSLAFACIHPSNMGTISGSFVFHGWKERFYIQLKKTQARTNTHQITIDANFFREIRMKWRPIMARLHRENNEWQHALNPKRKALELV